MSEEEKKEKKRGRKLEGPQTKEPEPSDLDLMKQESEPELMGWKMDGVPGTRIGVKERRGGGRRVGNRLIKTRNGEMGLGGEKGSGRTTRLYSTYVGTYLLPKEALEVPQMWRLWPCSLGVGLGLTLVRRTGLGRKCNFAATPAFICRLGPIMYLQAIWPSGATLA